MATKDCKSVDSKSKIDDLEDKVLENYRNYNKNLPPGSFRQKTPLQKYAKFCNLPLKYQKLETPPVKTEEDSRGER